MDEVVGAAQEVDDFHLRISREWMWRAIALTLGIALAAMTVLSWARGQALTETEARVEKLRADVRSEKAKRLDEKDEHDDLVQELTSNITLLQWRAEQCAKDKR